MAPWLNRQGLSDYQSWLFSSMAPWLNRQEVPTTDIGCTPWLPMANVAPWLNRQGVSHIKIDLIAPWLRG